MAGSMDERVVSMEFDNKKFEKNVKTSMKTIDDLKESLDFEGVGESLDNIDKKFKLFGKNSSTFSDVNGTVGRLKNNLSMLGNTGKSLLGQFAEVTKITAMFDLADQAVRRLQNTIKKFTITPIYQGFDKYNEKIGSIKTISNATGLDAESVNNSLDRLNWFTDETSASFTEMVSNIGKFTSVGKGLDESITAMQGIAAWGYHSGASVAEQTRAMYNLSQALGTGAVKLMDWKSIENAGMATKEFKEQAISAAEAAGKLKRKGDKLYAGKQEVTAENFNSTLAKGWFTSDVLMTTLEAYGGFADKVNAYVEKHPGMLAADAMAEMDLERMNDRLSMFRKNLDSLAEGTGKDASELAKSLNEIAEYASGKNGEEVKYEEYKKKLDDFARSLGITSDEVERINKISDTKERTKEIKKWAKTIGIDVEQATNILDTLADTEETLGEKAFKSSQQSKSLQESIEATMDAVSTQWMNSFQKIFGGLDDSITLWSDVTEILWNLFAAGGETRNNALTHWAEEFSGREDLWGKDGEGGILHNVMDTVIELKDLFASGFKNVFFRDFTAAFGYNDLTNLQNGLMTADQILNVQQGSYYGKQLKKITSGIAEFTGKIRTFLTSDQNIENFTKIFESFFSVIKFGGHIIGEFFSSVTNAVSESGILQDIMNFLGSLADKIRAVVERIQESGIVTKIFTKIGNTFVWFYNLVKGWANQISEFFEETGIGQMIRDYFNGILEFFIGGENDVDENGEKMESGFIRSFGWISNIKEWLESINFKTVLNGIKLVIENFKLIWSTFSDALSGKSFSREEYAKSGMSGQLMDILNTVEGFGKKLSGIWTFIKGIFDKVVGWLESSGILPAIRSWWDGISTFFGNIGLLWRVIVKGEVLDPSELDDKQKGLISGVVNFLKKIKNAWGKVKGWATSAWNWLKDIWGQFTEWLENSGILPAIRSWWDKISKFFDNIGLVVENFGLVWKVFTDSLSGKSFSREDMAKSGASGKLMSLLNTVESFGAKISGAFSWLEDSGILPTLRSWWASLTEWFEEVKSDLESNGAFQAVSDFFSSTWTWFSGLFGGTQEGPKTPAVDPKKAAEAVAGDGNKTENQNGNIFSGLIQTFKDTWTTDGKLDISKGFSTSIAGIFEWIGSIDWAGISTNLFGVIVKVVNGLNDAFGQLHYENILKVVKDVVSIFSSLMFLKTISDVFKTLQTYMDQKHTKTSFLDKLTNFMGALGQALLQIGIAVLLIAASMWIISKIDASKFDAVKEIMIGIGVFFVGFMAVAGLITGLVPEQKQLAATFSAIGGMFIQIGIAVALIVASIWLISTMLGENGEINDRMMMAMKIVAGIMGMMVAMIVVIGIISKFVGAVNVSVTIATFAGMAILLLAISACLYILQNLEFDKAAKNALILGGTLLVIALSMAIMKNVKIEGKSVAAMLALAAIIGVISAAFLLLKDIDTAKLAVMGGVFSGLMLSLAVSMLIISKIPAAGAIKGAAGVAAALVIISAGIAGAAAVLSYGAQAVANNFVRIMSSLGAAGISASTINYEKIKEALKLLVEIKDGLDAIGSGVDIANALEVASGAWKVLNKLKLANMSANIIDVSNFHKIFGEDGKSGLLNIIQTALSNVTDVGDNAKTLGANVEELAESLKLVGAAGTTLSEGGEYDKGIKNVKDRLTSIQEIVQMATSMGTTSKGEEMEQIDLTAFAVGIANIGAALQLYNRAMTEFKMETSEGSEGTENLNADEIAAVDTDAINAALTSVMAVLKDVTFDSGEISQIEKWAGLSSSSDGNGTLFALGLTNIADAMGVFSNAATNFNNENVSNAIASLGLLASIHEKVTNPYQYNSTISGVTSWGNSGKPNQPRSFANAISSMGTAMKAFGDTVSGINTNAVKDATTALDTLATIYEKLKGKGDMVSSITEVTKNWFGEKTVTKNFTKNSAEAVLNDFGTGVGYLGDAIASFGAELSTEEYEYDPDKVKSAADILEQMANMQKSLVELVPGQGFFNAAIFGENGLGKLGDNISGLGSRLSQFSKELAGTGENAESFDIDVNDAAWKNVTTVLSYFVGLATDLNNLSYYTENVDDEGEVTSITTNSAFTLESLANGLNAVRSSLVEFNKAMKEVHKVSGTTEEYRLGEWNDENFNHLKSLLTDMMSLATDIKNNNLQESDILLIGTFGEQLSKMFDKLNTGRNAFGNADNVSQVMEFAKKLSSDNGFNSATFSSFITNLKELAEAAGVLHSEGVDWNDIENLGILAERIMSITSTGFESESFKLRGTELAIQFISSFVNALSTGKVGEGENAKTVNESIYAILEAVDFFEKGKAAGEQYAAGFKEGFGDTSSFLTPIVSMSDSGKSKPGETTLSGILQSMNLATSTDLETVATHLQTLNAKFNTPINVNDSHTDIVTAIGQTNDNLKTIKTDVGLLKSEVSNLKVYINSKILVGAIAGDMDRELGRRSNLYNVSKP